ncbi:MAG: peptidase [Chitinophagales bacterium]|nr:MAG: peptidase [Chitinophagales bacterium]
MKVEFKHIQSAHCENGVTVNLLHYYGIEQLTEPLVFGIGSGIFFIYIPFLQVNNAPAISYRSAPGTIFSRTCKALDIPLVRKKFRSPQKAEQELLECLRAGQPVGCQVGVYFLPYFPREYRFHFNAHNLVVYGKENGHYLISDPVMETTTRLTPYELERVRFAKGTFSPKGQLYYPRERKAVSREQIARAIIKGIRRTHWDMVKIPLPFMGVNGIRFTARKIRKWRGQLGLKKAGAYLAQLVRMQEEIGTGGGGFRFIYAAFLQQAYQYIPDEDFIRLSERFTQAGDNWRAAAVQAAGIYKGRLTQQSDFNHMADMLEAIADLEKQAFTELKKIANKHE